MSKEIFQFLNVAKSAMASLQVRSALNPFLFLTIIVGLAVTAIVTLASLPPILVYVLISLFCVVVVLVVLVGIYFAVCKPDLLRSENYQIKKQSLELLGTKGSELLASGDHVTLIANPEPREGRP